MVDLGSVPGGSDHLRGYLAAPATASADSPVPAVVAIHELFGVDDVLRRQADRLAAAGYLTLAPDLFSDGGALRCIARTMKALRAGSGPALADIDFARQWVSERADTTDRVGVIGFCMGGGFALLTATRGFDVVSDNYGALPKDRSFTGSAPIVASYGGRDRALAAAPGELEAALTAAGVEHDVRTYPDAGHSFLNDAENGPRLLRPLMRVAHVGPEPASAQDAWARIEAFFARHLG